MIGEMKVISFCHFLQGPAASQYLADMGANVVKIEPLRGELGRTWAPANIYPGGVSSFYLCAGRNKRSVAIDLKSTEGMEIIWKLIAGADVVLENFRSGVMERLGLTFEAMQKVNPSIIYASGLGWGREGPMVGREGQDMIMQARTGLVSATGSSPTAVGAAVVDQHGGALLAMGVMAAYIRKLTTGKGCRVEGSLYAAGLDLQMEPLTAYLSGRGKTAGPGLFRRDAHLASWYHFAPYGVYQIADCSIICSAQNMAAAAEALDDDELRTLAQADPVAGRDAFAAAFAKRIAPMTLAEIEPLFQAHKLWYSKVFTYEEVADDPQAKAIHAFREIEVNGEPATVVNHPLRYDGQVPELRTFAFDIGQHTSEVLSSLGYTDEQVQDLAQRGIVGTPDTAPQVPHSPDWVRR